MRARDVKVADGMTLKVTAADVALVADEARLALKPAFALLDGALAVLAEFDRNADADLPNAARQARISPGAGRPKGIPAPL